MADAHLHKKRRTQRACAACRRRKIKCSGQQPCKSCISNELSCSYEDEDRRRNGPEYIQALEHKISELEALLGQPSATTRSSYTSVQPSESYSRESQSEQRSQRSPSEDRRSAHEAPEDDVLETMVNVVDKPFTSRKSPERYWSKFAELSLFKRMRKICSQIAGLHLESSEDNVIEDDFLQAYDCASPPDLVTASWEAFTLLPSQDRIARCVDIAIDQGSCLLSFIDRPALDETIKHLYKLEDAEYSNSDRKALALLFALLALGRRFEMDDGTHDTERASRNIAKGLRYFRASRSMLDVTDCHDIVSLQTVLCMIIYLQACSMMSTCYSYICAAVAAALRMGLHSSEASLDLPEHERKFRRYIFSVLNIMDTYVTTCLGLPKTLRDAETDQWLPIPEDTVGADESILLNQPRSVAATQAHAKLIHIMARAVEFNNNPIARPVPKKNGFYGVSYSKVVAIEHELDSWYKALPQPLALDAAGGDTSLLRSQLLLRLAYAHVQMVLYRPFLHHVARKLRPGLGIRYKAYACGSACVKAAMQVVWLAEALEARGLFNEASWFVSLIVSFAATILMLFVLSNEGDPTISEEEGAAQRIKNLLGRYADRSNSARRSFLFLQDIIDAKDRGHHLHRHFSSHTDDPWSDLPSNETYDRETQVAFDPVEYRVDGEAQEHTLEAMSYPRMHPYLDRL